jgi:hypothetical protein
LRDASLLILQDNAQRQGLEQDLGKSEINPLLCIGDFHGQFALLIGLRQEIVHRKNERI